MRELYFEDFYIGREFKTATYEMKIDEIIDFARQFDPQYFHTDETKARNSLFGNLAASGWHTAAVSMKLQVESEPKVAGGMIGTRVEIAWPKPTFPGDILQVIGTVTEIEDIHPKRGFVTMRSETKNQNGEVVMLQTARILVFKK